MPYKLNPFSGNLDYYIAASGNVSGVPPTTDKAIARWLGTGGNQIQNSQTILQDGGSIEAQGFITRRLVTDNITINGDESMTTDAVSIEDTGEIVIEGDGELNLV